MKPAATQPYSIHAGNLILVNRAHPLADGAAPPILSPANETAVLLERRAVALLDKLMGQICGWTDILPVSGWRSWEAQRAIRDQSLAENGEEFTNRYVAVPGCSEHQTGLAIDLGLRREPVDFIRPAFPYEGVCQAFRRRAAAYGFIQRYPAGKEAITGIAHEPWHFRYVGMPHAAVMTRLGLTLEEYHAYLRQFPYGEAPLIWEGQSRRCEIAFLAGEDPEAAREAATAGHGPRMLSGNNVDGYVVTAWREL